MIKTTLIIPSNAAYYLRYFESLFVRFLQGIGASKKTQENYRTDVRHFIVWLVNDLTGQNIQLPQPEYRLVETVTEDTIGRFKANLSSVGAPNTTVNRRLSTLRIFMKFCQDNAWIQENPAQNVRNIPRAENKDKEREAAIGDFRKSLIAAGESPLTVDDSIAVVRDFLQWVSQNP